MINPDSLTRDNLLKIAASVGERQGWDFTRVRDARDPVPWSYTEIMRHYLKPSSVVLDVGTGGGERFISLAPYYGQGIGVDISPAMIETARANLTPTLVAKISFEVMSADALRFSEAAFDVVLNRHAAVNPAQVGRVLKPGGYFITQQVGPRNTANVCGVFGVGVGGEYRPRADQELDQLKAEFLAGGCSIEVEAEYDVPYYFRDLPSFVFWLKAVGIPEDFDMARHWEQVAQIVAGATAPRGIKTNEHRQLLVVRKPQ